MSRVTCTPGNHFVLEGWEEIDRGICPRCGTTVVWDEDHDQWVEMPELVVLVLTREEVSALIPDPYREPGEVEAMIETQVSLQQEY